MASCAARAWAATLAIGGTNFSKLDTASIVFAVMS